MISKKEFDIIAKAIRVNTQQGSKNGEDFHHISTWLVEDLISCFEGLNPKFNADIFRKISGHEIPKFDEIIPDKPIYEKDIKVDIKRLKGLNIIK